LNERATRVLLFESFAINSRRYTANEHLRGTDNIRIPIGGTVPAGDVAHALEQHLHRLGLARSATRFTIESEPAMDWDEAMRWIVDASSDGYDHIRYIVYEQAAGLVIDLAAIKTIASTREVHKARIRWSAEHEQLGLPTFLQTTDPTWLFHETPVKDEAWSLVCKFEQSPAAQRNPSSALVNYLMPHAPHQLAAGVQLQMFERATKRYALVEIIN
jgi:hypothetical protein